MISWDQFKVRNPNHRDAFENLCMELFEREFQIKTTDIDRFHNQPGVEFNPIQITVEIEGKTTQTYASIQAKFTESGSINWSEYRESIKTAISYKNDKVDDYEFLEYIVCYSNKDASVKNETRDKIVSKLNAEAGTAGTAGAEAHVTAGAEKKTKS